MDKLSLKVLKYIAARERDIPKQDIIDKFGISATIAISFLSNINYISSGQTTAYDMHRGRISVPNGIYSITGAGLTFLQSKPWDDFDRWVTRITAIVGAITGIAALILEINLHFL